MTTKEIHFRDHTSVKASLFLSSKKSSQTLVMIPALGVRASYYKEFAEYLQQDYNIVTVDWRGHGASSVRPSRKVNFGFEVLVQDMKEVFDQVENCIPNTDKYLMGHSMGGQVGSLFAARYPTDVKGMILIASSMVYYKGWDKMTSLKIRMVGTLFYPLSKLIGYFPGDRIGFGGKEARWVMKDWGHNALTGKYEPVGSDFDYESALKKMIKPAISLSFEYDDLGSERASAYLYQKYNPESEVIHHHLLTADTGNERINHFTWAKKPQYIVPLIKEWLK